MLQRVLIEFVVDVPNVDVAKDVETRLLREHHTHLCEVLKSVTGYEPLGAPGRLGFLVAHEPVTWSESERDWIGENDVEEAADDDDDDDDDDE